jgi:predicted MPP superfamily phosphohydrolase
VQAWVSSGLGVSILPVRFLRRPEWLLFVIEGAVG